MNLNEIHSANKVFGGLVDNLHGGFGLVDNLSMTYEGNMLTSVRDVASRLPKNQGDRFLIPYAISIVVSRF